jgi:lipopolysaccharide/colanic/teichoic acid biosynthesis glycosyltransferase
MTVSNLAETFASRPSLALVRHTRTTELETEGARRALNVLVAAIGLVLAAPVLLVVAALIKLTSPGPVFFVQDRVGLDRRDSAKAAGNGRRQLDLGGKPFRIFKFRTMFVQLRANRSGRARMIPG